MSDRAFGLAVTGLILFFIASVTVAIAVTRVTELKTQAEIAAACVTSYGEWVPQPGQYSPMGCQRRN